MVNRRPPRVQVERADWDDVGIDFIRQWGRPHGKFDPEHLAILGPTGSGKSYFMTHVLDERANLRGSHVVILATKPADKTMKRLGWPIAKKWPLLNYDGKKIVYWPQAGDMREGVEKQREKVLDFLNDQWKEDANIVIAFDEISYVEEDLGLARQIRRYWREARALGITVVATTQRPFRVNRTMWSEASWTAAFKPKDEEDAKRVAEVLGSRNDYTEILMDELKPREFILAQRDSKISYITRIPTSSGRTPSPETTKSAEKR